MPSRRQPGGTAEGTTPSGNRAGGLRSWCSVFTSRRMLAMVLLGFSSGLPLPLTAATLQAWLTVSGLDLATIGLFSLVGLPYTVKFLWAPFMDRFVPPWLGRRRGWILISQAILLAGITAMALVTPIKLPLIFALIAFGVAFISASQDISVDAYRSDVLPEQERGPGVATFIVGYRTAMLVAGALAFILSDHIGWQTTYLIMAALMLVGAAGTLLAPEPDTPVKPPINLREAVSGAFMDFLSRPGAFALLFLILFYKLGDAYAGALTTPFLLRGVGFSATDVGLINKGMGLIATIVGALFGGALMVKLGLYRSLFAFGILQMVSNLSFMALAWAGKSYAMMVFAIAFENLSGGMGNTAFVAFVMALCNPRFSATQFALLSSVAAVGRVFVAPSSGFIVEAVGWLTFFFFTTVAALPGLFLVWRLREDLKGLAKR